MFDVGGPEFIVLIVLGLVLLGPKRLVTVAKEVGRFVHQGKRLYREATGTLEREIGVAELKSTVDEVRRGPRPAPHRPVKSLRDIEGAAPAGERPVEAASEPAPAGESIPKASVPTST